MTWSPKLFKRTAEVVARLRKQQGLSPEELAERAAVSNSTIRRLEKGKTVGLDMLDKILDALGVETFAELFLEDAEAEREQRRNRAYTSRVAEPTILSEQSPAYLRVQIGEEEGLVTITMKDLSNLGRFQPELPLDNRGD